MPIKVQTGETALQLAKSYDVKGSIPLELDETIVPVHIVGQLNPTEPTLGPAPVGAVRAWATITPTGSGAGSNKVVVLDVHPNSVQKPKILIESIRLIRPIDAAFQIGVGMTTAPTVGSIGTVQRFSKLDHSVDDEGVLPFTPFISSGVPPSLDLRMRGCNYAAGNFPGGFGTSVYRQTIQTDREIPMGIILGRVASRTVVGNEFWEDANVSHEAMNRGNAEFWVYSEKANDTLELFVRLAILP